MFRLVILPALLLLLAAPTSGQERKHPRLQCEGATIDIESRVAACTVLIDSSREFADEHATALLHRALAYAAGARHDLALADLGRALAVSPGNGRIYQARAELQLRRGRYAEAVRDFGEAIRFGRDDARSFHGRAQALQYLSVGGADDQAVRDYNAAVEREPDNLIMQLDLGDAWVYRVLSYLYVQDFDLETDLAWRHRDLRIYRSVRDQDHAVGLNPPDFAVYQTAPSQRHDPYRRAMAAYDSAIRLDPQNIRALIGRGVALLLNGEPDPAVAAFTMALRFDPANQVALAGRGTAWRDLGQPDQAIADYDALLQLHPSGIAAAWTARGNAFVDKAAFAQAIESFDEAIRANPSYAPAFDHRGVAYLRMGQYERAIRDATEAIRLRPWNPSAYRHRCRARALGRLEGAGMDCAQSDDMRANHPATHEAKGLASLLSGHTSHAIDQFDAALQRQPARASALYSRGIAYLRRGNSRAAIADIAIAVGIRPDIADEMAKLGVK